jgi:ABC-type nitrate/sulfonate/bicarbonate transport system substrate-binding protein
VHHTSISRKATAAAALLALILAACSSPGTSPSEVAEPTVPNSSTAASAAPSGSAVGAVELPAPELTDIRLGVSGEPSANTLHTVISRYLDLGKKYGMNITWSEFEGASQGILALIAEQIDVSDNAGGPAIASLATDSPLEIVYVARDNLTDNLYAQSDVTTADDLRGGSVAISSFGSQSHAGALLALDALGLTADDVTITQVGNDSARLAALQAGSVTASLNDATQADELEDLGLDILVRLSEDVQTGGVVRTSLTVRQGFAEQYPNTVLNLVAMYTEASTIWRNDPGLAAEALSELAEIPLEEAQSEVDFILDEPWRPLDGKCSDEVMEFTRQTLLPENPDMADVDPSEACTDDFIDQLIDLGFLTEVGVEGY